MTQAKSGGYLTQRRFKPFSARDPALKTLASLLPSHFQDGCWEIPRAEVLERGSGTEPTLQVPLLWEDVPVA